jgi:hypothetical protein
MIRSWLSKKTGWTDSPPMPASFSSFAGIIWAAVEPLKKPNFFPRTPPSVKTAGSLVTMTEW